MTSQSLQSSTCSTVRFQSSSSTSSTVKFTSSSSISLDGSSHTGSETWQGIVNQVMSIETPETSASSTVLDETDHEADSWSRAESQMGRRRHSPKRHVWRTLSGYKKSRLQHENTKKKQLSEACSPPRMSTRKVHWTKPEQAGCPCESFHHEEHKENTPASFSSNVKMMAFGSAGPSSLQSSKQGKPGCPRESSHHEEHKENTPASSSSNVKMMAFGSAGPSSLQSSKQGKPAKPKKGMRRLAKSKVQQEIKRLQLSANTIIPKRRFAMVVREVLAQVTGKNFNMQKLALQIIQEASEAVIVALMEGTDMLAQHSKRVTIMQRDLVTLLSLLKGYGNMQGSLS
ncbi:histone H3-like centromeric protein cpar-1 isoform X1 [Dermacentor silvarum]|uniref:histone H3-like centromeric protein cpar-1 isoform X1 n=1 Tax=Dermacentor silvarum TaxID=543639 RepID=UPI002101920B|nr:histone H3-like centromeric protein cpar-1 isoform X1 [Dermacentor silvarum]